QIHDDANDLLQNTFMKAWQNLENFLRTTANIYNFQEIRIPTFEQTELFSRGVGETTDVVQKEMYTVSAKESQFTLRPEGTAGTIRAMLQNGLLNEALPQKVYYILSCFRHERPQAGRLREFHQFGVEMAGSASPSADAEVISLAKQILDQIGLTGIELNINSIGCPECRKNYHKALKNYFSESKEQLCETCQERLEKNPMRILDCKSPICQEIAKDAPVILDYLCEDCNTHFEKLKANLDLLNIKYSVNPRIVRGLDYYTKTVFEFVTTDIGAQGTICGGGRYDGLIAQLGGQSTPALGFGMGLERLLLTLKNQGIALSDENSCDIYFVPMGEMACAKAMQLTAQLRYEGVSAQTDVMGR
ncbi:MAG: histidine--tRNA ligase, partial [Oscillospiraceae bacterium]|nr:histidine--tRNA ligase [Oscillospiraceae bacterium]